MLRLVIGHILLPSIRNDMCEEIVNLFSELVAQYGTFYVPEAYAGVAASPPSMHCVKYSTGLFRHILGRREK